MTLVDTSVWVEHLRAGVPDLVAQLEAGAVLVHPFVIGELACGTLRARAEVLSLLGSLPQVPQVTDNEALSFIEHHALMGHGIGLIDVHLLAGAALAADATLWTLDKRLHAVAVELHLQH